VRNQWGEKPSEPRRALPVPASRRAAALHVEGIPFYRENVRSSRSQGSSCGETQWEKRHQTPGECCTGGWSCEARGDTFNSKSVGDQSPCSGMSGPLDTWLEHGRFSRPAFSSPWGSLERGSPPSAEAHGPKMPPETRCCRGCGSEVGEEAGGAAPRA